MPKLMDLAALPRETTPEQKTRPRANNLHQQKFKTQLNSPTAGTRSEGSKGSKELSRELRTVQDNAGAAFMKFS